MPFGTIPVEISDPISGRGAPLKTKAQYSQSAYGSHTVKPIRGQALDIHVEQPASTCWKAIFRGRPVPRALIEAVAIFNVDKLSCNEAIVVLQTL
ncbi:hypothetical protein ColLi_13996 [Colletotrichum liriopes]|uniref:Uncharacterized protein n=1 Tax=Colletotrichum liriopes TaxID=708192 RepID=A0AA37H1A6_9PEZI|nr:hypothetical protein ColLi_13996 [Colletotrichum liriopes]